MRFLFSRQFEHFRVVYLTRNLRRASEEAGVTQPALTKSIRALEENLGTVLFERTPRGMEPTEAAHVLGELFTSVERQARFAHLEMASAPGEDGPEVRIGSGLVWSWQRVSRAVGRALTELGAVQVDLITGITEVLLPQLLEGELDLIVCDLQGVMLPEGFSSEIIWKSPRRLWVRAGHPLAALPVVGWEDLAGEKWAGYSTDSRLPSLLARQFGRRGLPPPRFRLRTTSLKTMLIVLSHTDLIGALADEIAEEAAKHGLVALNIACDEWDLRAGIAYRTEAARVAPFARILALLRESGP